MKRITIIISLLTINTFAATSVKDFSNLIGPEKPRKVFKELLAQHPIVVVKCLSTYCPKCKKIAAKFNNLAEKYGEKALFIDMNVQKFDEITNEFRLKSVPTFLIFVHGKQHKKIRGSGKLDEVAASIASAIKKLN